ncbi:MAG: argininosuccinate lyase [Planctomycetota bacterium]|nr:argininosuccinate lyase [Planctomycetota bacterium]
MAEKPWGGRFDGETDPRVEAFTESISFDHRLAAVDVRGSQAHARMLATAGLLTEIERDAIVDELDVILSEITSGNFAFHVELDDVHMHIESALIDRLGDIGRKLHTARSRNDQVSTDLKLYVRDSIDTIDGLLLELQRAFVSRSETDLAVILPAYTHLQRAQPVQAIQYWLADCEKFGRDRGRLADCRQRLNLSPLGAAALAGTSLPIDREQTANDLGFDGPAGNSLDISSDRDFLVEFTSALALVAIHLSGWAEEWILWCSTEFDMISLPDAYTTGSSIMPQKRNPDVLELIRGKSARVIGDLQTLLVLTKGLPLAYNRDLQEDKPALFDAVDTVLACLEIAVPVVAGATLKVESIHAKLEHGYLDATTLMEELVKRGVPQRTAHQVIGQLVGMASEKGIPLKEMPLEELQELCPELDDTVYEVLGVENAIRAFSSRGSTAPDRVAQEIESWRARMSDSTGGRNC